MRECPFCLDNWPNLNIVEDGSRWSQYKVIHPLNPVTPGHVLVISSGHRTNAAADPTIAGALMNVAAEYVASRGIEANIITSIGPAATQTVMHTHLHVVPRVAGDGLTLPWTDQQSASVSDLPDALAAARIDAAGANRLAKIIQDNHSDFVSLSDRFRIAAAILEDGWTRDE